MEVIQRFPKWLTEEKFDLHYDPAQPAAFAYTVSIYRNGDKLSAWGETIGQAAKHADELRHQKQL
jgi:hypothetical protein